MGAQGAQGAPAPRREALQDPLPPGGQGEEPSFPDATQTYKAGGTGAASAPPCRGCSALHRVTRGGQRRGVVLPTKRSAGQTGRQTWVPREPAPWRRDLAGARSSSDRRDTGSEEAREDARRGEGFQQFRKLRQMIQTNTQRRKTWHKVSKTCGTRRPNSSLRCQGDGREDGAEGRSRRSKS